MPVTLSSLVRSTPKEVWIRPYAEFAEGAERGGEYDLPEEWGEVSFKVPYPTLAVQQEIDTHKFRYVEVRVSQKDKKGKSRTVTEREVDIFGLARHFAERLILDWEGVVEDDGGRKPYDPEFMYSCFKKMPDLLYAFMTEYETRCKDATRAEQEGREDWEKKPKNSLKTT